MSPYKTLYFNPSLGDNTATLPFGTTLNIVSQYVPAEYHGQSSLCNDANNAYGSSAVLFALLVSNHHFTILSTFLASVPWYNGLFSK